MLIKYKDISARRERGATYPELAAHYGVSKSTIKRVLDSEDDYEVRSHSRRPAAAARTAQAVNGALERASADADVLHARLGALIKSFGRGGIRRIAVDVERGEYEVVYAERGKVAL